MAVPADVDDPGMKLRALITELDHAEGQASGGHGIKAIMDGGEVLADHTVATSGLTYTEAAVYFECLADYCRRQGGSKTGRRAASQRDA